MSYALISINNIALIPRHDYVHLINTFKNNKYMNFVDPYTYPRYLNTTTERKIQFWKKVQTEFHASRQSSYLIRKPFNSKSMVYKYFIATECETPSDYTCFFSYSTDCIQNKSCGFKQ